MNKRLAFQIFSISFIFFSAKVFAFTGASSAAIGDTGSGTSDPNDFQDINPAALAQIKGYQARAGYSQDQTQHQVYGVTLSDNEKDTIVPGALSYTGSMIQNQREQELKISFGNLLNAEGSAGIGVHYAELHVGEDNHRQINGVFGALYKFNSKFSVGAVADDFVPESTDDTQSPQLQPRLTVGSSLLVANSVRLRADVGSAKNYTYGRPFFGFGAETHFRRWLIGRAGYLIDRDQNNDGWTAGFGIVGKQLSVHYAYQNLRNDHAHFFDLSLPL